MFLPEDADRASDALREADGRLYAHKHQKQSRRDRPHEVLLQALYEREPELQGIRAEWPPSRSTSAALWASTGARSKSSSGLLSSTTSARSQSRIRSFASRARSPRTSGVHRASTRSSASASWLHLLPSAGSATSSRATHERWDGAGYPDGISGSEIPLPARIIAVCDAYDAMTMIRPYRSALGPIAAVAELERCAGSQFDPTVVAVVSQSVRHRVAA